MLTCPPWKPEPIMKILSVSVVIAFTLIVGCSRSESPAAAAPNKPTSGQQHGHEHAPSKTDNLAGPAAGSTDSKVQVVNALCPVLVGQSVGKDKMCDRSLVREFKGRKIGFCDPECRVTWDQLTDEQRQAYLDEALALEAKEQKKP